LALRSGPGTVVVLSILSPSMLLQMRNFGLQA
jgi:hypothetical protein